MPGEERPLSPRYKERSILDKCSEVDTIIEKALKTENSMYDPRCF